MLFAQTIIEHEKLKGCMHDDSDQSVRIGKHPDLYICFFFLHILFKALDKENPDYFLISLQKHTLWVHINTFH